MPAFSSHSPLLHIQNPVPRGWRHPQWRHLSTSPNLIQKILYKHAQRGVYSTVKLSSEVILDYAKLTIEKLATL